jgi:hypothetical protein
MKIANNPISIAELTREDKLYLSISEYKFTELWITLKWISPLLAKVLDCESLFIF